MILKLSQEDLSRFGESDSPGSQVRSQGAILVKSSKYFYRSPLLLEEEQNLSFEFNAIGLKCAIFPVLMKICSQTCCQYPSVKYDHLTCTEAHRCLVDLSSLRLG